MTHELTVWITPFTGLGSLDEAVATVQQMAQSISTPRVRWHPNLLVPLNFGPWPQAQCTQTLPADLLVGSVDDIVRIRAIVEAADAGFGGWSVPVNVIDPRAPDVDIPALCAAFAEACGYWAGNWEPDVFWRPGDDPGAVDEFWGGSTRSKGFWPAMQNPDAMSGNVSATVVPNGWGIGAFRHSLPNLAAGCGALALEVYGGLQTAGSYPSPNLWPNDGFAEVRATGVAANLIPIVARANLASQVTLANKLGHGQIQVWAA